MQYLTFDTLQAAEQCAAAVRQSGRRAYVLTMRHDCHQVRAWV